MANGIEHSLRSLPVEALIKLPKNDPRRREIEGLAALANRVVIIQNPQNEHPQIRESRLPYPLEWKPRIEQVTIGGKSVEELLSELRARKVNIDSNAEDMVKSSEFTTLPEAQQIDLVIAKVDDLVPNSKGSFALTDQIWIARDQLGLKAVPAETAFHYLFQKGDELKVGDAIAMSMKTIDLNYGNTYVFGVGRDKDGLWLRGEWTKPYSRSTHWHIWSRFAFLLPQVNKA